MKSESTAEVNSLVIVLPQGRPPSPPVACWGIVAEIFENGSFKIRVGPADNDEIYVSTKQVIPFLRTDGSFRDPQSILKDNAETIMLELLLTFLTNQGAIPENRRGPTDLPEPGPLVPILENTLVIILPGHSAHPPRPCWGLIYRRLVGGNYEVQVGRFRYLSLSRIIVQPDQLVPVYLTDGSYKNPGHAVNQLKSQLFLHLILMFYSSEGSNILRQIGRGLSQGDFVLFSRKGKTAPSPPTISTPSTPPPASGKKPA